MITKYRDKTMETIIVSNIKKLRDFTVPVTDEVKQTLEELYPDLDKIDKYTLALIKKQLED